MGGYDALWRTLRRCVYYHLRVTGHGQASVCVDPTSELIIINDRYRLLQAIGKGTTGIVYKAWDQHLDREVAVKACPSASWKTKVLGRLTRSMYYRRAALVWLRYLKWCHTDATPCYIMSLSLGQNLADLLRIYASAGSVDRKHLT